MKGKKILDLGCGAGKETVLAVRTGAEVTAVDYTQRAVELTQELLERSNLCATVKLADIEDLPFPDNMFDFAFSLGVIHHTPNPQKAMCKIHHVLKPNGIFVVMLYNKWTRWALKWIGRIPYEAQNWDNGCPIVTFYGLKEIKKLAANFKILAIRGIGGFHGNRGWLVSFLGLDRIFGWWYVRLIKTLKN